MHAFYGLYHLCWLKKFKQFQKRIKRVRALARTLLAIPNTHANIGYSGGMNTQSSDAIKPASHDQQPLGLQPRTVQNSAPKPEKKETE